MHRPFRYTLLASSLWFSCGALAQPAGDLPLMPRPQQVEVTQPAGKLVLDHRLSLTLQGDDLGDALPRWRQRIELQTGWTLAPMEEANGAAIKVVIRIGWRRSAAGKRRKLPAGGHAAGRHADRQHSLRRAARHGDPAAATADRRAKHLPAAGGYPRCAALPVARRLVGFGAPFPAAAGHSAPARRHGGGQA